MEAISRAAVKSAHQAAFRKIGTHSPVWIRKSISPRSAMRAIWLRGQGCIESEQRPRTQATLPLHARRARHAQDQVQERSTNQYYVMRGLKIRSS